MFESEWPVEPVVGLKLALFLARGIPDELSERPGEPVWD